MIYSCIVTPIWSDGLMVGLRSWPVGYGNAISLIHSLMVLSVGAFMDIAGAEANDNLMGCVWG